MLKKPFRSVVAYVISTSLLMSTAVPAYAYPDAMPAPAPAPTDSPRFVSNPLMLENMFAGNPVWQNIKNSPMEAPIWATFKRDEPLLDEDPYFLRSQRWHQGEVPSDQETRVSSDERGFDVQIAGASLAVRIDQPLKFAFEADDYLFFQATSRDFFKAKAINEEAYGEGLFFIDKRDLRTESLRTHGDRHGIPVMFLPLGSEGWTEAVQAAQIPNDTAVLTIRNEKGAKETFEFDDLDRLSKSLHLTLLIAVVSELRFEQDLIKQKAIAAIQSRDQGLVELPYVLPARGSTAVFGTYATFMNLDRPERSVAQILQHSSLIMDLVMPQAEAAIISPDLMSRTIWVLGVLTGLGITSWLAKRTILAEKVKTVRQHLEALDDQRRVEDGREPLDRTTKAYKRKAAVIDNITVFSQSLAVTSFLPKVSFGYILEYVADRFFGKQGYAPNGFIRRFIQYSLLTDRRNSRRTNSNAWTLWLGSVVLGGEDTSFVILQLMELNGIVLPAVGNLVGGPELAAQMHAQYSVGDAATANLLTSEALRNGTGYIISGGFSYAGDQTLYWDSNLRPQVEAEMRKERKNPLDRANQTELDRRVTEKMEPILERRSLPTEREHLFDATGMLQKFIGFFGYKVDREKILKDNPHPEELTANTQFVLEEARWGTLNFVLKRAIAVAKEMQKVNPSPSVDRAVQYLIEAKQEYNTVLSALKNPLKAGEALKKGWKVREMFSHILYVGDSDLFGQDIKFLYKWKGANEDPEAARLSARWLRQSFFSVLDGKDYYLWPDQEERKKYMAEALMEAEDRLRNGDPDIGYTEGEKQMLAVEIVKEHIAAEERKSELESWRMAQPSWKDFDFGTAERQRERVHARAVQEVSEKTGRAYNEIIGDEKILTEPEVRPIYMDAYRRALSDEVNLYALPPEQSALVRKAMQLSEEVMEASAGDPNLQYFLSRLSETEQVKLLTHLKAEGFLQKYVELALGDSSVASLTSPEQPGFFQKQRQGKLATRPGFIGKAVTTFWRIAETPWSNNAYGLGGKSWRHRNLPLVQDLSLAGKNRLKTAFGLLTAGYWANYLIWRVTFTWPTYLWLIINLTMLSAAAYGLDRFMMNIGKPAMDSTKQKLLYGAIWTWITWPLSFPFFFTVKGFTSHFDQWITLPLAEAFGALGAFSDHAITMCEKLLGM